MIGISACVGGEKVAAVGGSAGIGGGESMQHHHHHQQHGNVDNVAAPPTHNIHGLVNLLQSQMRAPNRDAQPSPEQFHFAVDHCFPMKGQGTVLTGTCLSGSVRPNDMIEFPTLAIQKKIKGLQMFRRKATIIQQGDRAGICVSNFDAKLMERGIIAAPGTVKLIRAAIAVVRKVRFFKGGLNSGTKFHISVGHTTVMATVTFWGAREIATQEEERQQQVKEDCTKLKEESTANKSSQTRLLGKSSLGGSADLAGLPLLKFDWNQDFLHQDNYLDVLPTTESNTSSGSSTKTDSLLPPLHWARLEFLTPVYCPMDSLVIGSRLDSEVNANACRLAFSGRLVERCDDIKDNGRLKTYTNKEKVGIVDRLGDPYKRTDDGKTVRYEVYGSDLFKKETNMTQFVGLLVHTDSGDVGSIQSSFGTSGQFRVRFPGGTEIREGDSLYLRFKRYANDPKKAIHQDGTLPPARTGLPIDPPVKKKNKKNSKGKNGNVQAMTENATKPPVNNSTIGDIENIKGDILLNNCKHTVAIVSGLFSMEDNINQHKGCNVLAISTNEEGEIVGSFGKMGKCKVLFKDGISAEIGSKVKMI
jgi:selenocysteine-specific elongation factor